MKTTLKGLLHAINILGDERDVTVDGIDSIAVCPPIKLTPEGLKYFEQALNACVVVEYRNNYHQDTYVGNEDERIDEKAWELLYSLAGYCASSNFDKWFKGKHAEMI